MNVPLVPEVSPPNELFETDKSKCVALRIDPKTLNRIRKERLSQLGLKDTAMYANSSRIDEELKYFDEIVGKLGCPVIDVSDKAIEETANAIMKYVDSESNIRGDILRIPVETRKN